MYDGFELPNTSSSKKTLPKGIAGVKGTLPKGYEMTGYIPVVNHYVVTAYCQNCGKQVSVGIKSGKSKSVGLKNTSCPVCGCSIKKKRFGLF